MAASGRSAKAAAVVALSRGAAAADHRGPEWHEPRAFAGAARARV